MYVGEALLDDRKLGDRDEPFRNHFYIHKLTKGFIHGIKGRFRGCKGCDAQKLKAIFGVNRFMCGNHSMINLYFADRHLIASQGPGLVDAQHRH